MRMTTDAPIGVLFAWFSPAFPTGAFAYSQGLEAAADDGALTGEDDLRDWLEDVIVHGAGWSDAVLMNLAHGARDSPRLAQVAELGRALAPSRERWMESVGQGEAFGIAVREGWPRLAPPAALADLPLPVAAGWCSAALGVSAASAIEAYLTGLASNLISAAVRLSLCGQSGGLRIIAPLGQVIAGIAARAARAGEDDLGVCALGADISSLRHEAMSGRVFQS
jgi:urease accessory protein